MLNRDASIRRLTHHLKGVARERMVLYLASHPDKIRQRLYRQLKRRKFNPRAMCLRPRRSKKLVSDL